MDCQGVRREREEVEGTEERNMICQGVGKREKDVAKELNLGTQESFEE